MSSNQQQSVEMRAHWKSLLAMTLVSLSSFEYGLDFGIIGGFQAMVPFLQVYGYEDPTVPVGYNISSERQQLISSLMVLGSFISSSSAGVSASYIGRKPSLWLASANGQLQKAERSLRWLRPQEWSVGEELGEMNAALNAERQLQAKVGYSELFRNPIDRRRTTVAVLTLTTQAASGVMFVIAFGTYFFEMANLIMAVVYTIEPGTQRSGKILVGLSVIYIVANSGLIAPYAWVSGGELPSQRLRSRMVLPNGSSRRLRAVNYSGWGTYTFGLATAIGFAGAWLTTFTAPYFINPEALNWGPKYGYIWAPSCAIAALWIYFFLPEAKGRSLEEIDEMFEARVPARKFASYRCTGQHAVVEKVEAEHCEKA
ncbi:hypothetical protein DL771_000510 [Monosporascus sp. 5C6A]|nr:hypothetical protein DL771_000510 [Monosporascus sp. 5C6A]